MLGLVTARTAEALDPDLRPLTTAMCSRLGDDSVQVVSWDDPDVDWSSFDAVVIRSTWDYTERLDAFLAWIGHVHAVTTLINDADVVRWSADKRYLADLAEEGVPIVPTSFISAGEQIPEVVGVHVVKPTVGAGSSGARRCEPHEVADHVAALHRDGYTAMVQPYLELLDERGETEHCFVVGDGGELEFSHAFRKGAILVTNDVEQEGGLYAKEEISPRTPTAAEHALATQVLNTSVVADLGNILFARVDIAPFRRPDGDEIFVVMEVELIEPSFYFWVDPASVGRFADGLMAWLGARDLCGAT